MKSKHIIYFITLLTFQNALAQSKTNSSVTNNKEKYNIHEIRSGGYEFINPLLDYYESNSSTLAENKLLQKKVTDYILKEITAKNINHASFYYRDLNNGPWVGVNEKSNYAPASLLKVPYLIAALKLAEFYPEFLKTKYKYMPGENVSTQNIKDDNFLIAGKYYSISDLLNAMIIHSDNEAKDIVVSNLPDNLYLDIFNDLGIDIQKYDTINNAENFLSVKEYASYFNMLYNSTYLNRQSSEYALSILSKTTFNTGIRAGVPDSIIIAHKFGERTTNGSDIRQLHDCGIVYMPNQPYILCVMTRGNDFEKMQKVIANISKIVYTHLSQKKTSKPTTNTIH